MTYMDDKTNVMVQLRPRTVLVHKREWNDRFPQRKNYPATWTALIWHISW